MTSLEVNAHLRVRAINPTHARNLRAGDTFRVEMALNPGLTIIMHLAHHVGSIVKDVDTDRVRVSDVARASEGCPRLDFGEPGATVIPAAAVVVEAFLDDAVGHVLEVDAREKVVRFGMKCWGDMVSHRTCGPEVLNTVHAMSVPGIAGPRLDIFSQFPSSVALGEYMSREGRTDFNVPFTPYSWIVLSAIWQ